MTSRTITMAACWVLMILHWTTDVFPGGVVPMAFCASFLILEWTGMFRRENIAAASRKYNEDEEMTERQKDFRRKIESTFKEEFEEMQADEDVGDLAATINMIDQDGIKSSVIIKADGEVLTKGNPNPQIVQAAKMLRESVIQHGPEAIADEIGKQLAKLEEDEDA